MDCLTNLSGAELTTLANAIAIYISKNSSVENIEKFVVFLLQLQIFLPLYLLIK